jgi:hypothetical protein
MLSSAMITTRLYKHNKKGGQPQHSISFTVQIDPAQTPSLSADPPILEADDSLVGSIAMPKLNDSNHPEAVDPNLPSTKVVIAAAKAVSATMDPAPLQSFLSKVARFNKLVEGVAEVSCFTMGIHARRLIHGFSCIHMQR